jgi:hypothetical protein
MVIASGLGLAGLLQAEPRLHRLLKYAGAAYLLYLAWRIARADTARSGSTRAEPITFAEAALFQCINPKGWVIALGALAALTTGEGEVVSQTAVIASVLAAACFAVWAGRGRALPRSARRAQLVDGRLAGGFLLPVTGDGWHASLFWPTPRSKAAPRARRRAPASRTRAPASARRRCADRYSLGAEPQLRHEAHAEVLPKSSSERGRSRRQYG